MLQSPLPLPPPATCLRSSAVVAALGEAQPWLCSARPYRGENSSTHMSTPSSLPITVSQTAVYISMSRLPPPRPCRAAAHTSPHWEGLSETYTSEAGTLSTYKIWRNSVAQTRYVSALMSVSQRTLRTATTFAFLISCLCHFSVMMILL